MAEEQYMTDFQYRSVTRNNYHRAAQEAADAADEAIKNGTDVKQAIYDAIDELSKDEIGVSIRKKSKKELT